MSGDVEARVRRANLLTRDDQLEQLFGDDVSSRLLGHVRALEEDRMTGTTSHERPPTRRGDVQKSTDVQIPSPDATAERRRPLTRGWVPALVAAALVLAVGVPALFVLMDGDGVAGGASSPVEIAEAYLDARNAYDYAQARELVSDTFVTSEPPDGYFGVDTMELAFAFHEAYGFSYGDIDCAVTNETPEGTWVDCSYLWTTDLHRAGGNPATPETLTFVVSESQIGRIYRGQTDFDDFWEPWMAFLDAEHPEFLGLQHQALLLDEDATMELAEQLPHYLDLYEEWLAAGAS